MNRRNFIKLIGGVAAAIIIPNIPLPIPKQRIKDTETGIDGREYECIGRYISDGYSDAYWKATSKSPTKSFYENPIFKGQYVQWDGVICHTS